MSTKYHDPSISEEAATSVDVVTEVRREAGLLKTGALQNAIFNSANFTLLQTNPEILAAQSRFEAATNRPSQAGALPEPAVSYTNFGVGHPLSRLNGSNFAYQGVGISQTLPFPGKLPLS